MIKQIFTLKRKLEIFIPRNNLKFQMIETNQNGWSINLNEFYFSFSSKQHSSPNNDQQFIFDSNFPNQIKEYHSQNPNPYKKKPMKLKSIQELIEIKKLHLKQKQIQLRQKQIQLRQKQLHLKEKLLETINEIQPERAQNLIKTIQLSAIFQKSLPESEDKIENKKKKMTKREKFDLIQRIKEQKRNNDVSIAWLSQKYNLTWRTIKKYLSQNV